MRDANQTKQNKTKDSNYIWLCDGQEDPRVPAVISPVIVTETGFDLLIFSFVFPIDVFRLVLDTPH